MNRKKWIVIAIALILMVAASLSQKNSTDTKEKDEQIVNQMNWMNEMISFSESVREEGSKDKRILVIPVQGVIGAPSGEYNHELILKAIDKIKEDESIQGVILEIDSPGGAVYHTKEAYDRLKEAIKERQIPIYASMGSVAASGGYYYAMAADKVFASEESITGSIGVISSYTEMSELYKKIGLEPVVYKSGDLKDMGSNSKKPTEEEKKVFQAYVDEAYSRFVNVVAEGRHMSETQVRELADGRIYSGSQAKEKGLIDEIGYFRETLAALRKDHQLEGAQVFEFKDESDPFNSLFPSFFGLGKEENYVDQFDQILDRVQYMETPKLEYRMEGGLAYD